MVPPRTVLRVPHLGGIQVGYRASRAVLDQSKPSLVLFNPFTTTADYYLPEFANEQLVNTANLIAVEPLGHGLTHCQQAETWTYWDTAIMTLQLLDQLGVEKAFAAGTSQGGFIAMRMALIAPDRVRKSTLLRLRPVR